MLSVKILVVLGALFILDSSIILGFPDWAQKSLSKIIKDKFVLKKIALLEMNAGLILLTVGSIIGVNAL